jgi:hypothetical protein
MKIYKKIILSSLLFSSLQADILEDMAKKVNSDSGEYQETSNKSQTELDKLRLEERNRLIKTQVKLQENPFAQKMLNDFVKKVISNSNNTLNSMIEAKIEIINLKIKSIYNTSKSSLEELMETKLLELETRNSEKFLALKNSLEQQFKEIEDTKSNLVKKQVKLDKKIAKLDTIFDSINKKINDYTSYIDSKFSLKGVKETELSRILLLKETFPIKYVKNFNSKSKITLVLNNNKEYKINSMLNERCRVSDLSRSHIKVQCIYIKNRLFENIMQLKITPIEDDYILNAIDKKIRSGNTDYIKTEIEETGVNSKNLDNVEIDDIVIK